MKDRVDGFYYVKRGADWTIAEWNLDDEFSYWVIPGSEEGFGDSYFEYIIENHIQTPDEKKED